MRYVTLRVRPTEGRSFHPLGEALATAPDVERGDILRVEQLDDGTCILLAEARGDIDQYREVLERSAYVYEYSVVEGDGWWYSYTHFEPTDVTRQMLSVQYDSALVMEMPIEVEPDGSMVVTLVGSDEALRSATGGPPESAAYDVEVCSTGDYHPDLDDLYLSLTERQREVLDAAVELGYYDTPRAVTLEELADALDASPSTVGEHLQKLEARVFSALAE